MPAKKPAVPTDAPEEQGPRHHVIGLKVRKLRLITAMDLNPARRGIIKVQGRNEQGKTTLLDSIRILMDGSKKEHVRSIQHGAGKASIALNTGTLTVTKQIEPGVPGKLKIVPTGGGSELDSPQAVLDELRGDRRDPMDIYHMSEKEQVNLFLELAGLSEPLAQLQADYDRIFAERTADGRTLTSAKGELAEIPEPPPADRKRKRMDPADVLAEQRQLLEQQEARNLLAQRLTSGADAIQATKDRVADIEKQQRALAKLLKEETATLAGLEKQQAEAERQYAETPAPDLGTITDKLAKVNANNAALDAVATWDAAERKVAERKAVVDDHTAKLEAILTAKRDLLETAKFPVPGLTYDGAVFSWKGTHLSLISDAQRLQLAMAIAMEQSPAFRVLWIKNGDQLDLAHEKVIHDMAVANDFQVFVENVRELGEADPDAAVVIEDGDAIGGTAVAVAEPDTDNAKE